MLTHKPQGAHGPMHLRSSFIVVDFRKVSAILWRFGAFCHNPLRMFPMLRTLCRLNLVHDAPSSAPFMDLSQRWLLRASWRVPG